MGRWADVGARWIAAAAVLGIACGPPTGATVEPAAPPVPPRPELGPSPDLPFPQPEVLRLSNGLEVDILRAGRLPLLYLMVVVRAGQVVEPPGLPGLADFTAEMLKEGTVRRTGPEVMGAIEDAGGSFEVRTDRDAVFLVLAIPTERAAAAIEAVAEMVREPAFPADEVERRRARELARLTALRADPQYVARVVLWREVYGDHPYARIDATPESLVRIQREHLVTFHRDRYAADGAFVVAAGDADPEVLGPLLERAFGSWPTGAAPVPAVPDPPAVGTRRVLLVDRPGSVQTTILVGFATVPMRASQWVPLAVANEVLGGGASSRLFRNLRERHGWTYGAYSSLEESERYAPAYLQADVDTAATGPALREVLGELRRLGEEAATAEELAARQAYMTRVLPLRVETPLGLAWLRAAQRINGLPADWWGTYGERVGAVTAAEARSAASRYLPADRSVVVVVGEADAIEPACREWGAVTRTDVDGALGETAPPR